MIGGSLFRIGVGATPFLLPLLLQLGFGMSPFQSGLTTFVSTAGALMMKATAASTLQKFGFKRVLLVNGFLASLLLAATGLFTLATPQLVVMGVLFCGGFFRSLQFTATNALAYADVSEAQLSRATSFYAVAQQLSLSAGVTVAAAALEIAQQISGGPLGAKDFSARLLRGGPDLGYLAHRLPAAARRRRRQNVGTHGGAGGDQGRRGLSGPWRLS